MEFTDIHNLGIRFELRFCSPGLIEMNYINLWRQGERHNNHSDCMQISTKLELETIHNSVHIYIKINSRWMIYWGEVWIC